MGSGKSRCPPGPWPARIVVPVGQGWREVTSEVLRVSDCAFCRIGRGEIDDDLVAYRSENVFVVPALKQRQNNPGHALVLPVSHVTGLYDVPVDLLHEIFEVTARVTSAVKDAYGAVGSTVTQNQLHPGSGASPRACPCRPPVRGRRVSHA
ncbi:HIT family protein [Streptomyces sp. NPDC020794]|uniref:HIT family protein n=1 Tax=unclassified Streptomyces TaxID=2593676 RepID=UPI0036E7CD21